MRPLRALLPVLSALFTFSCLGPAPLTPFEQAVDRNDIAAVKEFLAKVGSIRDVERPGYRTVIAAARAGQTGMLRLLAGAGADINAPDRNGNQWTPLMHAIHKQQRKSVDVLLELGANPNTAGGNGWTALIMASGYGDAKTVRLLLENGADPTARTRDGRTPLNAAVGGVGDIDKFTIGSCQVETVKVLLKANPSLRVEQNSALRTARLAGCHAVLALLK
jgi:ankyrin repeat protein